MVLWKALSWFLDNWHIPFVALIAIGGWQIVKGRKRAAFEQIQIEVAASRAAQRARRVAEEKSRQEAVSVVRADHLAALEKLSVAESKRAEELRGDPVKLAKFLVRMGH